MLTRYDARNVCYKMKLGGKSSNKELLNKIIELKGNKSWQDFDVTWDVIVKNDNVFVIPSIKDVNRVIEVCAKKNLTVEMGVEKDWDPDELAVIAMMEAQFLDNIMNWGNFRKRWNVRWNQDRNRIDTYLMNQPVTQTEVTQEMIDAKLREAMKASAQNKQQNNAVNLEMRPVTDEERVVIDQMIADGKI